MLAAMSLFRFCILFAGCLSLTCSMLFDWILVVAVGGIMGFAKSGSSKSLMAGGGSASILYYVFLNLPSNPVLASTIGLGELRQHVHARTCFFTTKECSKDLSLKIENNCCFFLLAGISGLLLFIMGSRYMESGKVFPAGVVSLFSLVMAGGYIHGIVRTTH